MLTIKYRKIFKRDFKRAKKRGKNLDKLKQVIDFLANNQILPKSYLDHSLIGNHNDHRECHLEADWLLIYKIDVSTLILERTGTHADLFE